MMIKHLILIMFSFTVATATSSMNGLTVKGYFNLDENIDTLVCSIDGEDTLCKIPANNFRFKIIKNNNCSELSIKKCTEKGCLKVQCSIWGYKDTLIYTYDKARNDFYMTKKIHEQLPMHGPDDVGKTTVYKYTNLLWNIDNTNFKIGMMKSPKVLDDLLASLYKSKDLKKIQVIAQDILNMNMNISKRDLTYYNNIAYYLEKAKAYKESIYLLEKILEKYPNRTVAYYNLGDSYWGLDDKVSAKKAYKTYIKQMKEKGKENKIPTRVYNRVNK